MEIRFTWYKPYRRKKACHIMKRDCAFIVLLDIVWLLQKGCIACDACFRENSHEPLKHAICAGYLDPQFTLSLFMDIMVLELIPNWKTCFENKNATMFPLLGIRSSCLEFRYGNSLLKKCLTSCMDHFQIATTPMLSKFNIYLAT